MPVNPRHAEKASRNEEVGNRNNSSEEIFIPEEPKFSLDEIILPAEVKAQILDVATYNDNAHRVFELWGFKRTHKFSRRIGINLYGAPGTGKTMAAHAIAKMLERKILVVNYADTSAKRLKIFARHLRRLKIPTAFCFSTRRTRF